MNINKVVALKKQLKANDIKNIVIASKGGKTAIELSDLIGKDFNIISISEFAYSDKNKKSMKKKKIQYIEEANLPIQDIREMRETLMMFDSGIKAAVEVASIAYSRALVDDKMAAIAGGGLHTVILIDPTHPEQEQISEPLKRIKIEKILFSPII